MRLQCRYQLITSGDLGGKKGLQRPLIIASNVKFSHYSDQSVTIAPKRGAEPRRGVQEPSFAVKRDAFFLTRISEVYGRVVSFGIKPKRQEVAESVYALFLLHNGLFNSSSPRFNLLYYNTRKSVSMVMNFWQH